MTIGYEPKAVRDVGRRSKASAARGAISSRIAKITQRLLPERMVTQMRTRREWDRWISLLSGDLLDDLSESPAEVKRELFRRHVKLVEVEVHAKCNRICPFCPNSIVDRRRNNSLTDPELLDRVCRELALIDFRGQIKIARYSEPLSNLPYLYERIASARKLVPNAQLAIVTNTDYLTPVVLEQLRAAGLNTVYMSIYLKSRDHWSLEVARDYSDTLGRKLGVRRTGREETLVSVRCTYEYDRLALYSSCMNFDEYGSDRGNVMEQYSDKDRVGPCREPFETFVIDYTGAVMPCCNLRSDIPQQRDFIAGDLSSGETSIYDVYAGTLSQWRQSMLGFGPKANPCKTCRHRDVPGELVSHVTRSLDTHLYRIGRK
jgi:MoaA/NifB/PqqE/SkfB family radical SAM enzyme